MKTLSRRRLLVAAGGLVLAGCVRAQPVDAGPSRAPSSSGRPSSPFAANAALGVWPDFVTRLPATAREAYAYAAAGPRSLRYVPCYCGCGAAGHTDNLDCYIQSAAAGGWVVLDRHASACGVCIDITRQVMAMEKDGRPLAEIRRAVDQRYAGAGPSTPTPFPD